MRGEGGETTPSSLSRQDSGWSLTSRSLAAHTMYTCTVPNMHFTVQNNTVLQKPKTPLEFWLNCVVIFKWPYLVSQDFHNKIILVKGLAPPFFAPISTFKALCLDSFIWECVWNITFWSLYPKVICAQFKGQFQQIWGCCLLPQVANQHLCKGIC